MRSVAARLGTCVVVVAALLRAAPGAAAAGEPEARLRAQELLEQGNHLFRDGDVRGALERYRSAYGAFASPKLLFNIARCEESLGERPQAMQDFARFLADAPGAAPEARAEAEQRTRALAPLLTPVDIAGPDNALVQLDGVSVGMTPLKIPLWTEPGLHQVAVEHAGRAAWVTTVVARAGVRVSLSVPEEVVSVPVRRNDEPAGPPAALEPENPGLLHRWWFWTAVGAVLVGGTIGTVLIVRDLRKQCPPAVSNGCE